MKSGLMTGNDHVLASGACMKYFSGEIQLWNAGALPPPPRPPSPVPLSFPPSSPLLSCLCISVTGCEVRTQVRPSELWNVPILFK